MEVFTEVKTQGERYRKEGRCCTQTCHVMSLHEANTSAAAASDRTLEACTMTCHSRCSVLHFHEVGVITRNRRLKSDACKGGFQLSDSGIFLEYLQNILNLVTL